MIGIIMQQGTEIYKIVIDGNNIKISDTQSEATIENIKFSKSGVIREFPDLKDNPSWRSEAIKRFKAKLSTFHTEGEKAEYIISDLRKYGFIPRYKQKSGHRVEKIT